MEAQPDYAKTESLDRSRKVSEASWLACDTSFALVTYERIRRPQADCGERSMDMMDLFMEEISALITLNSTSTLTNGLCDELTDVFS